MAQSVFNGYLGLSSGRIERTVEVSINVLVDVGQDGEIVGVETLGQAPDFESMLEVLRVARIPENVKTEG